MSIILNEYKWAEQALQNRDLGRKPSQTLGIVAKYYLYTGTKKKDLRKALENFYMQCRSKSSVKDMNAYVDNAIEQACKYPLSILDEIIVTDAEMKKIDSLDGAQLRKLAFTMLCIAKHRLLSRGDDNSWVSMKDSDIMKMANISTSIRRQCALFGKLIELGLLIPSKKVDNLSTQVTFMEDGTPAIYVRDFRNLGHQYMMHHGGPFYVCQRCGLTERVKNPGVGRPPKYCDHCANEVLLQRRVNATMRFRASHKVDQDASRPVA